MSAHEAPTNSSLKRLDPTNTSNVSLDRIPERLDSESDVSGPGNAKRSGSEQMMTSMNETNKPTKGSPKLLAASALTSLKPSPKPIGEAAYVDIQPKPEGEEEEDEEGDELVLPERFTKSGRKKATPFPLKLMKVLSTKQYSDIITWNPDGESFVVQRPKAFAAKILPKYFKSAKYSSFTRKLHRWGFQRHLRGPFAGAFFHKNFQRDRLDLAEQMTCYKHDPSPVSTTAIAHQMAIRQQAAAAGVRFGQPTPSNVAPAGAMQLPTRQQDFFATQTNHYVAEQLRRQQQQQQQQQLLLSQAAAASRPNASVPMDTSVNDLNAAIELEVTRRLKQRIQAASMSRQALAMMQHQTQPQPATASSGLPEGMQPGIFPAWNPGMMAVREPKQEGERTPGRKGHAGTQSGQTFDANIAMLHPPTNPQDHRARGA